MSWVPQSGTTAVAPTATLATYASSYVPNYVPHAATSQILQPVFSNPIPPSSLTSGSSSSSSGSSSMSEVHGNTAHPTTKTEMLPTIAIVTAQPTISAAPTTVPDVVVSSASEPNIVAEIFTSNYVNGLLVFLVLLLVGYGIYLFLIRMTQQAIENHTKERQNTEELVTQYTQSVRGWTS